MLLETESRAAAARPPLTLRDLDPALSPYRGAVWWVSCWQLASTLLLFVVGWTAMYLCLDVSYWLTLALAVPTALVLVRLFILQHDCGHRSFFQSKRANDLVGRALGVLTFTPYDCWRREHAMHHACSGDLDRRGKGGEILTMTVEEYRRAGWFERLYYRVYRHPLVLFGVGPFLHFVFRQRLTLGVPRQWKKERRSILWTNVGLLATLILLGWLVGPWKLVLVHVPVMFLSAGIGVWLFFIQHQYEEAFWKRTDEWDYVQAALAGSSYYRLPKILQWCTGNIGFHHVHHLDARIPNYRLQPCHDTHPELQHVHEFSLRDSVACLRAKLWDEEQGRMVGFEAARV